MQRTKRPLSLLLTLALLLSLFAGLTLSASAEGGQKVETATALEDGGLYIIADTDGKCAMSVKNPSGNTSCRAAVAIEVTDGVLTAGDADLSDLIWTCTSDTEGMKLGNDSLYLTANYSYLYAQETPGSYCNTWALSGGILRSTRSNYATYCIKYETGSGFKNAAASSTAITLYKVKSGEEGHTHSYTESVTKPATCGENGEKTFTCTCGDSYTEPIPATGEHTYEDGVCTVCGAAEPAKLYWAAKAETFEGGKTYLIVSADKTSAMSAAAGTTTGTLKAESVALDEKAAIFSMAVSPETLIWTAESDGAGFQLKNGGKYLTMSKTTTVEVADSNTSVWNITADGLMSKKSTTNAIALVSGAFKPANTVANKSSLALAYEVSTCNHNWENTETETESTCTVPGYVLQRCTICNGEQKHYKPLAAHSLSDGVCMVCGQILSVRITEADTLEAGKRYLIADSTGLAAMSCENGTGSNADKYRGSVTIQTADGGAAANGEDMSAIIWTAETADDGGVKLSVTKGTEKLYLAAKSAMLYAKAAPADGELTSFTYTAEKLFYATGASSYVLTKGTSGFFPRSNYSGKTVVYEVNPAPAAADPFALEAAKGEDGTVTVTVKAAKAFAFSVMELTLRCTYGGAVLESITSAYADASSLNTAAGYAGLYAAADTVSVKAGDVLAVYTYRADGSNFRFRMETGDCYAGTGDDDKLPWSADYTGEDKIDEFPIAELGTPGEDPTGFAVTVENKNSGAVVSGLDGLRSGETTFTVANDKACVVLVKTGDTYTRLTAVPTAEANTCSFTLNVTADTTIVVALKGDVNGDGKVNSADSVLISRSCLSETQALYQALDTLAAVIADVNADGKVNSADSVLISRSCLSAEQSLYQAISW